jgi:hypothetical protein
MNSGVIPNMLLMHLNNLLDHPLMAERIPDITLPVAVIVILHR